MKLNSVNHKLLWRNLMSAMERDSKEALVIVINDDKYRFYAKMIPSIFG